MGKYVRLGHRQKQIQEHSEEKKIFINYSL